MCIVVHIPCALPWYVNLFYCTRATGVEYWYVFYALNYYHETAICGNFFFFLEWRFMETTGMELLVWRLCLLFELKKRPFELLQTVVYHLV